MFTQTAGITTDDGTLTLASSGMLNLQGGALFGVGTIKGGVTSSGTVAPGDIMTPGETGTLGENGAYTQNSTGTLNILIKGTTAGTQYDQLNPTTATLNGTLNISLDHDFVPIIGNTFKIMNFNSKSGTFATVNGLGINMLEHFTITYQATDVLLTVVPGPLPKFSMSSTVGPAYRTGARSGFSHTWVNSQTLRQAVPQLSTSRFQTNLRAYLNHGVIRAAELASMDSVIRRNALNRPAARRWPMLPGSGETPLWAAGRIATFLPARNFPAGAAPHRSPSAGASGGVLDRINPAATLLRNNRHTPRMMAPKNMEYHLELLSLLGTGRRQALRDLLTQPGNPNAASLGYLTFSGSR
jgi:hypothetical protein